MNQHGDDVRASRFRELPQRLSRLGSDLAAQLGAIDRLAEAPALHVPQKNAMIVSGRCQPPAIGREHHLPGTPLVAAQGERTLETGQRPELDVSFLLTDRHPLGIGREIHANRQDLRMPAELLEPPMGRVDDQELAVCSEKDESRSVRREASAGDSTALEKPPVDLWGANRENRASRSRLENPRRRGDEAPVGGEVQGFVVNSGHGSPVRFLSPYRPEKELRILGQGHESLAVVREPDPVDPSPVAAMNGDLVARFHVPDDHGMVLAGARQPPAVGREIHPSHRRGVAGEVGRFDP